MTSTLLKIAPVDSWFFREPRPFGRSGGVELESVFPPPARTIAGALRSRVGEHLGDHRGFAFGQLDLTNNVPPIAEAFRASLGDRNGYGALRLRGPRLLAAVSDVNPKPKLLFPAPLAVRRSEVAPAARLHLVRPGLPVACDLGSRDGIHGKVRLPALPNGALDEPLNHRWITKGGLEAFLTGKPSESLAGGVLSMLDRFFEREFHVGIGRDLTRRVAADERYFQTEHLRPSVVSATTGPPCLIVEVSGIDLHQFPMTGPARFGGEGRLAVIEALEHKDFRVAAPTPGPSGAPAGIILVLLTDADLGGTSEIPGFTPKVGDDGTLRWHGTLEGIQLRLVSAVLGKHRLEGGWNVDGPAPVRRLVPAGSVWYFECDDPWAAVLVLHHTQLAGMAPDSQEELKIGRGEVAAGVWYER